ncbi:hypothetical protein [Methanoculleus sp. UBA303]|jgi:hypothetical protein|uniref:hypothetical protein n=1 Tax=Methanoculleus sp. UBA303 TaxID=1915497 RepID=UPI0025F9EAA2|nr:hypothetical protein [Methanoculleus sp. UBA303]
MDIRYIISLLILLSLACTAAALPVLPDEFAGSVTLDGKPAPAGTVITARIDWNERGSTVTTKAGEYGPLDSPGVLAVRATEEDLRRSGSPIITFWVNGHKADQEVSFTGGATPRLDLSAVTGGGDDQVPVASGRNSFGIEGVGITDTDGGQQVVINNRTVLGGITTNETAITLSNVDGWEEVVIFTRERPAGDLQITGTIESVHARSSPINTGSAWAQVDLEMSRHPGSTAQLNTTIYQNPNTDEQEAFETVVYQMTGKNINSFAYVLNIQKTNVANEGDGGIIRAATIRMAASPEWVASMGGEENVVILRQADDGITTRLDTCYTGRDAAGNYIFEAVSPGGLSAFALVATKAPGSSTGDGSGPGTTSGGGGGSSKDPGSQLVYDPSAPEVHTGRVSLTTSPTGVVLESVTIRTADETCAVAIREGTTARDADGNPLGEVTTTRIAPADVPAAPPGTTVAIALSCGPAGATFNPPAVLTYTLSGEEWAKIDKGATPKVMWYNPETGKWQDVPATVDPATRTVTAQISHFSIYALVWTAPETVVAGAEGTVTPGGEAAGEPGPVFPTWALALVVVLIAALVAFLVMRRK